MSIDIPYPTGTQFFTVKCRLARAKIDSTQDDPSLEPMAGTVTIAPLLPFGRGRFFSDGRAQGVISVTETYAIRASDGELVDEAGHVGVQLPDLSAIDGAQGYEARIAPAVGHSWTVQFTGAEAVYGVLDLINADAIEVLNPVTNSIYARVATLEAATGGPPSGYLEITDVRNLSTALDAKQAAGSYASSTQGAKADTASQPGHAHLAADVTGFAEAAQDAIAAMLTSGANITLTYDDAANKLTATASGPDAEAIRDTIGVALAGMNGVTVTLNDAADTITLGLSGITIPFVTGLQAALDAKASSADHTSLVNTVTVMQNAALTQPQKYARGSATITMAANPVNQVIVTFPYAFPALPWFHAWPCGAEQGTATVPFDWQKVGLIVVDTLSTTTARITTYAPSGATPSAGWKLYLNWEATI